MTDIILRAGHLKDKSSNTLRVIIALCELYYLPKVQRQFLQGNALHHAMDTWEACLNRDETIILEDVDDEHLGQLVSELEAYKIRVSYLQ